jgi:hypothetical protein
MDWHGGGGLAVFREGAFALYVSSSQLNFGRVYIPNSLNLKLKIRNVGTKAIGLNGISFSGGDVFRVLNSFPINLSHLMILFLLILFSNHYRRGSIKIQRRFQRALVHFKFI